MVLFFEEFIYFFSLVLVRGEDGEVRVRGNFGVEEFRLGVFGSSWGGAGTGEVFSVL